MLPPVCPTPVFYIAEVEALEIIQTVYSVYSCRLRCNSLLHFLSVW